MIELECPKNEKLWNFQINRQTTLFVVEKDPAFLKRYLSDCFREFNLF